MKNADTIFAPASGPGKAAVKVFRISGVAARSVAEAFHVVPLPPRLAVLRRLTDPSSGEEIDSGLVLWFPAPVSFTGEDCLEFQVHGGVAVEQALLRALAQVPGCRMAEPGEFAWRAFSNRKLDLTAVEGLADLIDAETEAQRRQALRLATGALFTAASRWRSDLVSMLALVEGRIDFEDEADAPKTDGSMIAALARNVLDELHCALDDFRRAEIAKRGFRVVVLGPPNAGKSSLFNALLRREAAIVSPSPGTTRDLIEASMDLHGVPVIFTDTAGLRSADDPVEAIGIARAQDCARQAHLILWLAEDLDRQPAPQEAEFGVPVLAFRSKADLREGATPAISALTGRGLPEMLNAISDRVKNEAEPDRSVVLTRARHFSAVAAAAAALKRVTAGLDLELAAEELREAARNLESLIGRIDSEDVLADIFARFCIGK